MKSEGQTSSLAWKVIRGAYLLGIKKVKQSHYRLGQDQRVPGKYEEREREEPTRCDN